MKCCGCGYCRYWNGDEELVTQEYLKLKASESPCAKLICFDCNRGYDRHNIQKGYILCSITLFIVTVITLDYFNNVYRPTHFFSNFKKTTCKVEEIEFNENITASCVYQSEEERVWRDYKCLRIHVSFFMDDAKNHTAVIAESFSRLQNDKYVTQCSTRPSHCQRYGPLDFESIKMLRYYTNEVRDRSFDCMYNPERPSQVLQNMEHDLRRVTISITLLGIASSLFALILVFMCCTCGCQYIWASKVPIEILQEAQKRRAENRGLSSVLSSARTATSAESAIQMAPIAGASSGQVVAIPPSPVLNPRKHAGYGQEDNDTNEVLFASGRQGPPSPPPAYTPKETFNPPPYTG